MEAELLVLSVWQQMLMLFSWYQVPLGGENEKKKALLINISLIFNSKIINNTKQMRITLEIMSHDFIPNM